MSLPNSAESRENELRVVAIGGGTGLSTLLTGLKAYAQGAPGGAASGQPEVAVGPGADHLDLAQGRGIEDAERLTHRLPRKRPVRRRSTRLPPTT